MLVNHVFVANRLPRSIRSTLVEGLDNPIVPRQNIFPELPYTVLISLSFYQVLQLLSSASKPRVVNTKSGILLLLNTIYNYNLRLR